MFTSTSYPRFKSLRSHAALVNIFVIMTFLGNLVLFATIVNAQLFSSLPDAGEMVTFSDVFDPVLIKGLKADAEDPLLFEFIIDRGDTNLEGAALEEETQKLVKYFLAALTIPDNDVWVNLSPYEKDMMIPNSLGLTELGRDMLVQDYLLKQITASLTNPDIKTGQKFWQRVYDKAIKQYGTTDIPINTFSKVWIVPDTAVVLEKEGTAFVADSHLKVMLEQDYLALEKNLNRKDIGTDQIDQEKVESINDFTASIVNDVILPELEKEINTGKNFSSIRQIYNSVILALWYKKALKQSLLGQVYVDKAKIAGVDVDDPEVKEKIYDHYMQALKKGVYDMVKDDYDAASDSILSRRYFSGGITFRKQLNEYAQIVPSTSNNIDSLSRDVKEEMERVKSYVQERNPRISKVIVSVRGLERRADMPESDQQRMASMMMLSGSQPQVKNIYASHGLSGEQIKQIYSAASNIKARTTGGVMPSPESFQTDLSRQIPPNVANILFSQGLQNDLAAAASSAAMTTQPRAVSQAILAADMNQEDRLEIAKGLQTKGVLAESEVTVFLAGLNNIREKLGIATERENVITGNDQDVVSVANKFSQPGAFEAVSQQLGGGDTSSSEDVRVAQIALQQYEVDRIAANMAEAKVEPRQIQTFRNEMGTLKVKLQSPEQKLSDILAKANELQTIKGIMRANPTVERDVMEGAVSPLELSGRGRVVDIINLAELPETDFNDLQTNLGSILTPTQAEGIVKDLGEIRSILRTNEGPAQIVDASRPAPAALARIGDFFNNKSVKQVFDSTLQNRSARISGEDIALIEASRNPIIIQQAVKEMANQGATRESVDRFQKATEGLASTLSQDGGLEKILNQPDIFMAEIRRTSREFSSVKEVMTQTAASRFLTEPESGRPVVTTVEIARLPQEAFDQMAVGLVQEAKVPAEAVNALRKAVQPIAGQLRDMGGRQQILTGNEEAVRMVGDLLKQPPARRILEGQTKPSVGLEDFAAVSYSLKSPGDINKAAESLQAGGVAPDKIAMFKESLSGLRAQVTTGGLSDVFKRPEFQVQVANIRSVMRQVPSVEFEVMRGTIPTSRIEPRKVEITTAENMFKGGRESDIRSILSKNPQMTTASIDKFVSEGQTLAKAGAFRSYSDLVQRASPEFLLAFNQTSRDFREVGGIDLSEQLFDFKVSSDGSIKVPVAMKEGMEINFGGLEPVIIEVAPATPDILPLGLGEDYEDDEEPLAAVQ